MHALHARKFSVYKFPHAFYERSAEKGAFSGGLSTWLCLTALSWHIQRKRILPDTRAPSERVRAGDDSDLYYAGSDSSFGTQEKPFQFTWTPNSCAPLLHRHGTYVCQRVTS